MTAARGQCYPWDDRKSAYPYSASSREKREDLEAWESAGNCFGSRGGETPGVLRRVSVRANRSSIQSVAPTPRLRSPPFWIEPASTQRRSSDRSRGCAGHYRPGTQMG